MAEQPSDDLIIVAASDDDLPLANTSNKIDPREDSSREYVITQGYDTEVLPCQELNYILNNLGSWLEYVIDEYSVDDGLLPDNNLSDVTSVTESFDNIKQSATTEYEGVVELATSTETQTGVNTTKAVTPEGLASLTATESLAGLIEIVDETEMLEPTTSDKAITPERLFELEATYSGARNSLATYPDGTNSCSSLANDGTYVYLFSNFSGVNSGEVYKYSSSGSLIETITLEDGDDSGDTNKFQAATIDSDGNYYYISENTYYVYQLDSTGSVESTYDLTDELSDYEYIRGLYTDGDYFYVLARTTTETIIFLYDTDFNYQSTSYDLSDYVDNAYGLSSDGTYWYIQDNGTYNIHTFDSAFEYVDTDYFYSQDIGYSVTGITVLDDIIYVGDQTDGAVVKIMIDAKRGLVSLASSDEVEDGSEAFKAVTPYSLANTTKDLDDTGYFTMPGGLMFQWGSFDTGSLSNTDTGTESFPTEFSNNCFQVILGANSGVASGNDSTEVLFIDSFTTSDFDWINAWSSRSDDNGSIRWFAIGN